MSSCEPLYSLVLPSGAVLKVAAIVSQQQLTSTVSGISLQRQCEKYSWQCLVREILGDPHAQFSYNEIGAPIIEGSPLHISVSHSATMVAVIVSAQRCAIDIESTERNFERVASRYVSSAESQLQMPVNQLLPQLWSIKETLYKYAGRKELNLLDDITVHKIEGSKFTSSIAPHDEQISGEVITILGHTLAYIG